MSAPSGTVPPTSTGSAVTPAATEDDVRRRFLQDLGLMVVTLGFYMPYWLYKRNDDLRLAFPTIDLPNNVWLVSAGVAVSAVGRFWFSGWAEEWAGAISMVGVTLFAVGSYLLADNARRACEAVGVEAAIPPWLFGAGVGVCWLLVELGHFVPSVYVRVPALLFVVGQAWLYWRVHVGVSAALAAGAARGGAPPPRTGSSVTS